MDRKIGSLLLLMILGGGFVGCTTTPRLEPTQTTRQGRVFLFRGLLDVFSLGMNTMAEDLRKRGVDAQAMSGPGWPKLSRELKRAHREGTLEGPLVFVGHSYGADDAIYISRDLEREGVTVGLLALIDSTKRPRVPANVERVVHVFRPSVVGAVMPFIFAGSPVKLEEGNIRTEIVNHNLTVKGTGAAVLLIDHFSIEESHLVHKMLIDEILRTCPPKSAYPIYGNSAVGIVVN